MTTSVLIAAYNAAGTIEATLRSVFNQSVDPAEVVVLLDGGEDATESRLEEFRDRIRLLKQANQGIACARNRLVRESKGDILAFVDADDLWHPKYLETQCRLMEEKPEAVASFTGHITFHGKDYTWADPFFSNPRDPELIDPVSFFIRYNTTTGVFGSMSYCCVSRRAFDRLDPEPFTNDLHGIEDSFLCYALALLGPVAYDPSPLVAYRLTAGSLSENRIRNLGRWVTAFARLEHRYLTCGSAPLRTAFSFYYASKRREYAKLLAGAGRLKEAQFQLLESLRNCKSPSSIAKSIGLLGISMLPSQMQPAWPSSVRQVNKTGPVRESSSA